MTDNGIGKEQTIGIEIEFARISREKAAKQIAGFFGTQARYTGGAYSTWEIRDSRGRVWKIMRDSSINDVEENKCELVTPILHYEDMELLQAVAREIRHAGGKSCASLMAGVHIHIGADGHNAKTLRNLANLMASHEHLLIDSLRISDRRRNSYCQTVDPRFLRELNKKKPKTMNELKSLWYDGSDESHLRYSLSRYKMLNYHSVFSKGTVEFRLFQFSEERGIHAGELKGWVQLCLALSNMAKHMTKSSPKQAQTENPKYALRCWLLRLGFIGDEFETARHHLLKNLPGDSAFRHGRVA